MKTRLFLLLLLPLFIFSCGENDNVAKTDNLFKFKKYISYHTTGESSIAEPIKIGLATPVESFDTEEEIPADYIKISPKIEGKLSIKNSNLLIFQPKEYLRPGTEYAVTLKLDELYEDIDKEYENYTFVFKTIEPNFKIQLGALQSYDKSWQYLTGIVETSDVVLPENAKKLISASQQKTPLSIQWEEQEEYANFFRFRIDSISRYIDDSQILIEWNGKSINAKSKGENTVKIPGKNNFTVVDMESSVSPQASLAINFSDPLLETQDFSGLISIENTENLRFEVDGNLLHVYPTAPVVGNLRVNIFPGIQNNYGYQLKETFSEMISFEQLKPAVELISKGVILPVSASTPIYFKAVNLEKVDVRVIKIYENNILQFLQSGSLGNISTYHLNRVGRRIAKKTISLENNSGQWKAYGIDLSKFFKADPGALYRVEISFKKEYSNYPCENNSSQNIDKDLIFKEYDEVGISEEELRERRFWDNEIYNWRTYDYNWRERDNPCHNAYYNDDRVVTTNILGSNLGLIVKEGSNNSYRFATTNILTAKPEGGVHIKLFDYQQRLIAEITSENNGLALFDSERNIAFAIAQKGKNYAYAELEDGDALSMSNFDIDGKRLQQGLKGFLYTERGVHRPGDTIHLTFALNDRTNLLPEGHPVKLEVTDARGRLVHRDILTNNSSHGNARSKKGFYYFPIPTHPTDPTGSWHATVSVGGAQFEKSLHVATVKPNRLKINLYFQDRILSTDEPIHGTAQVNWLHGAPARNLNIEIEATLTPTREAFENFKTYNFSDPVRSFQETTISILDSAQLSATGSLSFSKKINLSTKAPGMLDATFLTKVFEGGGGFSMDVISKKIAPFPYFVGLHSPEAHRYGSYHTGEDVVFEVISVDAAGNISGNRNIKVELFQIEWRWWWNRGSDNLSRYENATTYTPFQTFQLTTDRKGKSNFTVNIPDEKRGRYLIRVLDEQSGHASGRVAYFYKDWWKRPSESNPEAAKMLIFSADKEAYKIGETAHITFPSGKGGHALISVENGTEVLSTQWVETEKGETKIGIQLTEEMAPNVYANISLIQPHELVKNDLPVRLYGVVPILVENPATKLHPTIEMPEVLRPEKTFSLNVSEEKGKKMTYTVAVVDEGLLDLTRFETPKIHEAFYSREALGVKTFDIYDYIIGAYSGSVDNIYAIGGGDVAAGAKNRKAERFKPVVKFLGPFDLKAGEKNTHQITLPNYIGSVRTMVVAGDNLKSAYGNAEKTTPVRTPLMVLASIPRKLSPGEIVTIPVTVFVMENQVKNVDIQVKTSSGLKPLEGTTKTVSFKGSEEKNVNFKFEVLAGKGVEKIEVSAKGSGESSRYETEIDVENPNPISRKSSLYTLSGNESQEISFKTFGIAGSNEAKLVFSTLPPMDFENRLDFLIRYPHGCVEQITSGAFPQLFLSNIFDLSFSKKQEIEENIKIAIEKIGRLQLPNGGLAYWPGDPEADEWSSNYVGHFMLESGRKGYSLPLTFMDNWISFQKKASRQWRANSRPYNTSLLQAYRLYTLALAGHAELAAMNRLRKSEDLSNDAKWRLAAAYAITGKKDIAQEIANTANIHFEPRKSDYYTYGSPFRNRAMALETMVLLEDPKQRELAVSIAKNLSSDSWYSTQETAYALLAISKMVEKNGGKSMELQYTSSTNLSPTTLKTEHALAMRGIPLNMGSNKVSISNKKDNTIYVTLSQSGKLPLGEELALKRNLEINTIFLDGGNNPIDISSLHQGTGITAKISLTNTSPDEIQNIALTQIFPGGWEIVNTSFTALEGGVQGDARYIDIRDDRVNFYFDMEAGETRVFKIDLNASYLGKYYLPSTQAEAMYDDAYFARNRGRWVEVVE